MRTSERERSVTPSIARIKPETYRLHIHWKWYSQIAYAVNWFQTPAAPCTSSPYEFSRMLAHSRGPHTLALVQTKKYAPTSVPGTLPDFPNIINYITGYPTPLRKWRQNEFRHTLNHNSKAKDEGNESKGHCHSHAPQFLAVTTSAHIRIWWKRKRHWTWLHRIKCGWVLTVSLDLLFKSKRVAHRFVSASTSSMNTFKGRSKNEKIEIPMAMDEIRFFMGDLTFQPTWRLIGNRICFRFVDAILVHARKINDERKLNEFTICDLAVASIEVFGNNVFGIFYSFFLFGQCSPMDGWWWCGASGWHYYT